MSSGSERNSLRNVPPGSWPALLKRERLMVILSCSARTGRVHVTRQGLEEFGRRLAEAGVAGFEAEASRDHGGVE